MGKVATCQIGPVAGKEELLLCLAIHGWSGCVCVRVIELSAVMGTTLFIAEHKVLRHIHRNRQKIN